MSGRSLWELGAVHAYVPDSHLTAEDDVFMCLDCEAPEARRDR